MLGMKSKHFIDTIKLITYRAEAAMANIVRKSVSRQDDARSLLRSLYATEADTLSDLAEQKPTVRLHQPANRYSRDAILHLIGVYLGLSIVPVLLPITHLFSGDFNIVNSSLRHWAARLGRSTQLSLVKTARWNRNRSNALR